MRTKRQELLRLRWTPKLLEEMKGKEGFTIERNKVSWEGSEIIADPLEREKILKTLYYSEIEPSGMTKMIQKLNRKYIGFKSREVRDWVRKQQSYQDSRTVFRQTAKVAMIIPKKPFYRVETDCMLFSTSESDLRANGGYHILSTYTD